MINKTNYCYEIKRGEYVEYSTLQTFGFWINIDDNAGTQNIFYYLRSKNIFKQSAYSFEMTYAFAQIEHCWNSFTKLKR